MAGTEVPSVGDRGLGRSPNRWFVMWRLMAMCGLALDAKVAERIAIEIVVEEAQWRFRCCAMVIDRPRDDYRSAIAEVLAEFEREKGTVV